ncbi:MAG TPA: PIN domain-containing protein, partial [Daejeonella sp.]
MRHIFMDTNVVIDFLAGREPFATDAARLFNLAVEGKVKIYISAVSYNNIYYVLRQSAPGTVVIKLLEGLADITQITDVTGAVIRQ